MGNRQGRSVLPDDGMSVLLISRDFFLRPDLKSIPRFQEMKEELFLRFISAKNLIQGEVRDVVIVSHRNCGWLGCRHTCRTQGHSAGRYRNSLVRNIGEKKACGQLHVCKVKRYHDASLRKEAVSDANNRQK